MAEDLEYQRLFYQHLCGAERVKSINWEFVKRTLKARRQEKKLSKLGYRRHETDWEIIRGSRYNEVILDAVVSTCGKYVYTKIGVPQKRK